MARRWALADLPEAIPLFPLSGALLLPRARLPLNIFEPRYLAMLEDALKTPHRLVGLIQPFERAGEDPPALRRIGCAGRVCSFTETDDGRYLIALHGLSRFRLTEELQGFTPYRRARVDWVAFESDLGEEGRDPGFDRERFLGLLARYFETAELSTDWESLREADDEMLVSALSMMCPFAPEEKQALLEAADLAERRETLSALMEFAIAAGGEDEGPLQ